MKTLIRWAICGCFLLAGCGSDNVVYRAQNDVAPSGRELDLAINGTGYFIVQTPTGGYLFTRTVQLYVGADGWLVNEDGYKLAPRVQVQPGTGKLSVSPSGAIMASVPEVIQPTTIGQIKIATFPDESRVERDGIYVLPTAASGDPVPRLPGQAAGVIAPGEVGTH